MTISYIGADVDCKMTELAVEKKRTIVQRDRIPTNIRSLRGFLAGVPGRKIMVIEECPMSGWLYRNLHSYVERFVVCDPRRNKAVYADGDKTDPIDAAALAKLCRGRYIREVYHTDDAGRLALKCAVMLYHDRMRDAVRQINKLRGHAYGGGLRIPSSAVRSGDYRKHWLSELEDQALAERLEVLWVGLDAVRQQVKQMRSILTRSVKTYPIIAYWQDLPGVGLIRAATLFAYLDTPWRFKTPKKLWKYCGLGLRRTTSGTDKNGSPKPGYLRLYRAVNRRLKGNIQGAALSAIRQYNNPFATYYYRAVQNGMTPSNARHSVGRKMLSVMWGMWKTNSPYDACSV